MTYGPDDPIDLIGVDALYVQLAAILEARISRGDWATGHPLPSEAQMQQEYGVSRTTTRKALALLAKKGLTRTLAGRGTFVIPKQDRATPTTNDRTE
jgi:GntR family transcriptional regulator